MPNRNDSPYNEPQKDVTRFRRLRHMVIRAVAVPLAYLFVLLLMLEFVGGQRNLFNMFSIESWRQLPKVGFLAWTVGRCIGVSGPSKQMGFVIDNLPAYEALIARCKNIISLPAFDFSSQVLIGTEITVGCCANLEIDLRRDDRDRVYRYIVEKLDDPHCAVISCISTDRLDLVATKKLSPGYSLRFEFYPAKR